MDRQDSQCNMAWTIQKEERCKKKKVFEAKEQYLKDIGL